jgi:hypothetical protein
MSYCELDIIEQWLRRYVHYTSDHCAAIHVAWCAHTLLMEHWDISPRLGFFSALPGSGKTNALMLTSYLCAPPGRAGNISVSISTAVMARRGGEKDEKSRAADIPPQFLDEVDNFYNAASKEGSTDATTAVLNGGYKRGAVYERMAGPNKDKPTDYRIFGAVAMAGLGKARLPDALTERLLKIPMEPLKPDETVERFRQRILETEHRTYRDAQGEFCARADGKIDLDALTIPDAISGRDVDNWEPLLAVGAVAGGDWPQRIAHAALWYCAMTAATKRDSLALRLLKEVVEYLQDVSKAETRSIWQYLRDKPGAPWCDFRFFTESWIRETLYQFPGAPKQGDIRIGQIRTQGFHIDWFADLIERYLPPSETPDTPDTFDNKNNVVGSVVSLAGDTDDNVVPLGTNGGGDRDPFAHMKDARFAIKPEGGAA